MTQKLIQCGAFQKWKGLVFFGRPGEWCKRSSRGEAKKYVSLTPWRESKFSFLTKDNLTKAKLL